MSARLLLGWTGACILVLLVAAALAVNVSDVSDYLTTYPLERLSQALSGVAFTAPLTAGFCAFNAARLQRMIARPHPRNPLNALVLLVLPGVLGVFLATICCAVVIAGLPQSESALVLVGLVAMALCASGLLGAAVGLVTHPAVGTPLSVLSTFAWFAFPVSTGISWLRTANTAAPLASCCAPEQQYQVSTLATSAAVSAIMILGFAAAVAVRSRRVSLTLIVVTVVLVFAVAVQLGRANSFDGLTVRTDRPICTTADGFEVCVWNENQSQARPQAAKLVAVSRGLQDLDRRLPVLWSESPLHPTGAASTTTGADFDDRTSQVSILTSLVQYWGCDDQASQVLVVGGTVLLGHDIEDRPGPPEMETVMDRARRSSRSDLVIWLNSELTRGCPRT